MAVTNQMLVAVGAKVFLDAKIMEFEAACYLRNEKRITEMEENCRSALSALCDAKRALVERVIKDADQA